MESISSISEPPFEQVTTLSREIPEVNVTPPALLLLKVPLKVTLHTPFPSIPLDVT